MIAFMGFIKAAWKLLGLWGVLCLVCLGVALSAAMVANGERERADKAKAAQDVSDGLLLAAQGTIKSLNDQAGQNKAARDALTQALQTVADNQKVRYVQTSKLLDDHKDWALLPIPSDIADKLRDDPAPEGDNSKPVSR